MINQPTNYLPVQQAAVQQQIQQNQASVMPLPPKGPQYNAIKIDIQKPQVGTADPIYSMPYTPIYSYPPAQEQQANQ